MRRKLVFFLLLCFSTSLHPWWDAGHLIVAEIAYQNLTEEKQRQVDHLCMAFNRFFPKQSTFATAAIWADTIKEKGTFPLFDRYHYINLPYDPDKILTKEKKAVIVASYQSDNVIWIIDEAKKTLKNPSANEFEKALLLRLLIHCIADIHQPLHCASLYNKKFPNGDMGGNRFALKGTWSNLHLLWDAAAGAFSQERYMQSPFDYKQMAQSLMRDYPKKTFTKLSTLSPKKWAEESHQLAIDVAYDIEPNTKPSAEYLEKTQEVCRKQVALAGYRLAETLNGIKLAPLD